MKSKIKFASSFLLFSTIIYTTSLGMTACVQEYLIEDREVNIGGVPNPPDLENDSKTDVITQSVKSEVDVLWVIDNSCSMSEEQATLVYNFEYFINYFIDSTLDWHIGVVSTDMQPGETPGTHGILNQIGDYKFIDESTPNPVQVFSQMATMGTRGSGTEEGTSAIFSAISTHDGCEHNRGFYRPEANLSIIVISDEEDFSTEPILPEFIDWLSTLKEDVEDINFSSIVCLEEQTLNGTPCGRAPFYAPSVGSKYMAVTQSIGGILWDIREQDWSSVLDRLGLQATGLKYEFFLSEAPIQNSLEVWAKQPDGVLYNFTKDVDYFYSQTRNSITFIDYLPPENTKINIKYDKLSSYYGDLSSLE